MNGGLWKSRNLCTGTPLNTLLTVAKACCKKLYVTRSTGPTITANLAMTTVKFYDLLSIHPKVWWSPNTMKTRMFLNYKKIPYTTIGVHYPDIKELQEKFGMGPNERWPFWSLPMIEYEGTVIRGSYDIAIFLEQKFPEPPLLGDECEKWVQYLMSAKVLREVRDLTVPIIPDILDERDAK